MCDLRLPISDAELKALALRCACGAAYLAEELAQHVRVQYLHEKKYDPCRVPNSAGTHDPSGAFERWAKVCMWRYRLSARRKRRMGTTSGNNLLDVADPKADLSAADFALDMSARFCEVDRADIFSWPPLQRFATLRWYGMLEKLDPEDQLRTIREAKVADAERLQHLSHELGGKAQRELAAAIGVTCVYLRKILERGRRRLKELRFVRELRAA